MIRLSRTFYLFISRLMETFIASILLSISIYLIASRVLEAKNLNGIHVQNVAFVLSAVIFIALYIGTSIWILQSVMKLKVFLYLNMGSYLIYVLCSIGSYVVLTHFFPTHRVIYTFFFMPTLSLYPLDFKGLLSITTFHFIVLIFIFLTGYIGNNVFNRMLQKTRHLNIDEF